MPPVIFGSTLLSICLYVSLAISGIGILARVSRWFTTVVAPQSERVSAVRRVVAAAAGLIRALFSWKIFRLFRVMLFDVLLQWRILKSGVLRWWMHVSMFFGFMLLILMHALGNPLMKRIFPAYLPTLDPYQLLRNLFGVMVLSGAVIALVRRLRHRGPMLETRAVDRLAIALVLIIIVSGFLVEITKIVSERSYVRMTGDYSSPGTPADADALKAYWSAECGTVFSSTVPGISREMLARGRALNEEQCSSCHSSMKSAFISYPLARAIRPAAGVMGRAGAEAWLYYLHVIACCVGIAYLPFGKFFHILTNPLSLAVNGLQGKKILHGAGAIPRRAMELDACTNCGSCNTCCSVAPVFRMTKNNSVLPSHKLDIVRSLGTGKEFDSGALQVISEGAHACTSCYRCTEVCPAGINLQDQWQASRAMIAGRGYPLPHVWIKELKASEWSDRLKQSPTSADDPGASSLGFYNLAEDSDVFAPCIQCQTCTNVCPVVAARTNPEDAVDITPQKIMNLLRLGLVDLAMGSRMVWDCATCYQCQENCPQGIRVTMIIYELKNRAYEKFKKIDRRAKVDVDEGIC